MAGKTRITQKMKHFAHLYVFQSMSAVDAYVEAYDTKANRHVQRQKSWELIRQPGMQVLLNELRAQQAELMHVSAHSLAGEFEEIKAKAMEKEQFNVALNAVVNKAKLFGFLDNKQERPGDMTDEEAQQILREAGIITDRVNH